MSELIHLKSIAELQKFFTEDIVIQHPLVAVIDLSRAKTPPEGFLRIIMDFYTVVLKDYCSDNMRYGRKTIDFQSGSIICLAPNQLIELEHGPQNNEEKHAGWAMFFHPDLIRGTSLDDKLKDYSFFSYEISEALHLSEKEHKILTRHVNELQNELSENIDLHTQSIIVASIELILNYCTRFYSRQHLTRKSSNHMVVAQVEAYFKNYFEEEQNNGLPTVKSLAGIIGLSPGYLSDLLKKETGRNAQDHIHFFLIERAKSYLVGTHYTVNEIAFSLGFEYPQYFSKLFKQKTGRTPAEYRNFIN